MDKDMIKTQWRVKREDRDSGWKIDVDEDGGTSHMLPHSMCLQNYYNFGVSHSACETWVLEQNLLIKKYIHGTTIMFLFNIDTKLQTQEFCLNLKPRMLERENIISWARWIFALVLNDIMRWNRDERWDASI